MRFLDCHLKTEDQVWQEILSTLHDNYPNKFEYRIISGRSGILKDKVADWLTRGALSRFVLDWTMDNPGSYIIRFKFPEKYEIIKTNTGKYKIIEK